ncbi:MAG TPA: HD domain-containing protein [Lentimicrobium sp.]|nr:HD domain-containing protein [Lentimicrobium sp.]
MTDKTESVNYQQLIDKTAGYVESELKEAEGGHDWHHIKRVWNNALYIAKKEKKGDLLVIQLAALLHDIADAKFHNGDETIAPRKARNFLHSLNINEDVIEHVINIVENISYRKRNQVSSFNSIELQIVQDADRLDAIGAIGIARVFNFGGFKNRPLYDPSDSPSIGPGLETNMNDLVSDGGSSHKTTNGNSSRMVNNVSSHTIGHFYEKLLLLSDMMNTKTGRKLAKERHDFMVLFLNQFYKEWNGKF